MTTKEKKFYILAGANGAGKTTLSRAILKDIFHCQNFVNADEIAKGLSPLDIERFDMQAGKLMIKQIEHYIKAGENFCVETTLATKLYLRKIKELKELGYKIFLFFIYLPSSNFAIKRVKRRVQKGGHNISKEIIERRYKKGLEHLMNDYFDYVDDLYIYSNIKHLEKIATKIDGKLTIYDKKVFKKIEKYKTILLQK